MIFGQNQAVDKVAGRQNRGGLTWCAQIEVNGEADDAPIVHGRFWTTALQIFMDLIIVVVKYDSFFL